MDVLTRIKQGLFGEAEGILKTAERLDDSILSVLDALRKCQGKIIFSGVGKSGHIGKKLAATYASLGLPAFFVQSTESLHGDLGMIGKSDIVLLLSNSGGTSEVVSMIPNLKKIGCKTIAFTSKGDSKLAQLCDYVLTYHYDVEADDLNLAPTTSSTVMLALGDAIAVTLASESQFTPENFHLFHPGGSLGNQLEKQKI